MHLVLVGGGHSHVAVLRRFGMKPLPGVRVTLVSRGFDTPYSGMLPGLVAGHYTYDEAHIDLPPLARFAGARCLVAEAAGLDLAARQVVLRDRPPLSFDLLSIDIGSTPNASAPGAADHAVAVKPIDRFLGRWEAVRDRLMADEARRTIAVVGGGAGGVELLLSVQFRMGELMAAEGRADRLEYHLFTAADAIVPTHNRRARARLERVLRDRGVRVHTSSPIVAVEPGRLKTASGEMHDADEILWTTEARAAAWIQASGLATDERGFVRVAPTLESVSHRGVFAAGDVAAIEGYGLEKSGVFAVRQGEVLAGNLSRALLGRGLKPYRPQRQFLSLISTGDRRAVASRGPFAAEGRWVWHWKRSIDRRFMRRYQDLPAMQEDGPMLPAERSRQPTRHGTVDTTAVARLPPPIPSMRCGGCGAKVGATVLSRALARVRAIRRDDVIVGLDAPDDAAVVRVPDGTLMVHTVDFFRAIIDDPFVFGKIAATHALGDVYAMGAQPQTALAIVTLPYGPEIQLEETLVELMAGAGEVLGAACAALVGGHTSEGAELGLGFAVNGLVEASRVMRKAGLRPGDRLVLTKPLGTGTLFAADMRGRARGVWLAAAVASMTQSNRTAAECFLRHGVSACTDVTGFGLLGHLVEMLEASGVGADIDAAALPLLPGAEETARAGLVSSLHPENARLRHAIADAGNVAGSPRYLLLFDPQTSGGLLAGVAPGAVDACIAELRAAGCMHAAVIGTVRPAGAEPGRVSLTSV